MGLRGMGVCVGVKLSVYVQECALTRRRHCCWLKETSGKGCCFHATSGKGEAAGEWIIFRQAVLVQKVA